MRIGLRSAQHNINTDQSVYHTVVLSIPLCSCQHINTDLGVYHTVVLSIPLYSCQHISTDLSVYHSCAFHLTLQLSMLADDRERSCQVVNLLHEEFRKNPANLLDHHSSATTHLEQSRGYGDHHLAKAMEMDCIRHAKRASKHQPHCPTQNNRRHRQEMYPKEHLV